MMFPALLILQAAEFLFFSWVFIFDFTIRSNGASRSCSSICWKAFDYILSLYFTYRDLNAKLASLIINGCYVIFHIDHMVFKINFIVFNISLQKSTQIEVNLTNITENHHIDF